MTKLFTILTYIGAVVGGIIFALGIATAKGAPQEASISAMALVFAILPYTIARLSGAADDRKRLDKLIADLEAIRATTSKDI